MKLVFMGTPDFAVPVLRALSDKHQVICVYTQPPRPAGRGHKLTPSPVQVLAESLKIPVRSPTSLKSLEIQKEFADLQADAAIVAAYGLILPQAILEAFPKGCINVHGSLLPKWRGAAPVQRALMAGDEETGVTIMQMDEGLDTGAMLLKKSFPITEEDTTKTLMQKVSFAGAEALLEALELNPTPTPQPEEGSTYAAKIKKEEGLIDWSNSTHAIERQIRAIPSWFMYKGEKIKIQKAALGKDNEGKNSGTILQKGRAIAAKDGAIELLSLQREGRAALSTDDFLRGFSLTEGENVSL